MREIAQEAVLKINFKVDLDATLRTLSVAEKQMVAICRALMQNTKLLIMDEPTTALTKKEVKALFDVIKGLKEQGISILFVSHKLDEVFEISDRFTIVRNGRTIATGNTTELDNKMFSYYMTGREFESKPYESIADSSKPLLEVRKITKKKGFKDISFTLCSGEIKGITGLLDSGRSELALSLFGIAPIDSGEIAINGKVESIRRPQDAIKLKIGYVPEDRLSEGLFLPQSIGDNIVISEIDSLARRGILDKDKYQQEVKEWVSKLAIATPNPENAASTLSGGNQQRIVLAKWLACKPRILILNGPTVGVDIGSKYDLHKILQDLAKEGMAVLIISDDLPEIIENCSKVLIMKGGRMVDELDTKLINEKEILDRMM
jgi:simple sugar transport system ATP-binding protein